MHIMSQALCVMINIKIILFIMSSLFKHSSKLTTDVYILKFLSWRNNLCMRLSHVLVHLQVCDDSNQASGFAAVGTTAGLGRLMVSL